MWHRGSRAPALLLACLLLVAACGDDGDGDDGGGGRAATTSTTTTSTTAAEATSTTASTTGSTARPSTTRAPSTTSTGVTATSTTAAGPVRLEVGEVARGLDTVWSLAWDREGGLWFTERPGRLSRVAGPSRRIDGVVEQGESGLMGLEVDGQGRAYLMYTSSSDNRIVRTGLTGGDQEVLVDGLRKAAIHDGGRLRLGPDGMLYATTGDAADTSLPQDDGSRNGKVLRIDPGSGQVSTFSKGHRNAQGLCFAPGGRLYATEHGPDRGDEVNILTEGFNGGWPDTTGTGIRNYTPTIAPGGCVVYDADLIPQWKGSLLFVTLKDQDLRRLTLRPDGSVAGEEILFDRQFGRLRDVAVGPDGAVYLTTSNKDGRGNAREGDDRILRVAPAR